MCRCHDSRIGVGVLSMCGSLHGYFSPRLYVSRRLYVSLRVYASQRVYASVKKRGVHCEFYLNTNRQNNHGGGSQLIWTF